MTKTDITFTPKKQEGEKNKKVLSGVNVQTSKVYVKTSDYEENLDDAINITVGVFFDGTNNNRTNVEVGEEHRKKEKGETYDKELEDEYPWFLRDSYDNGYSNIARLEPFYENYENDNEKCFSVYIEGIGTKDLKWDNIVGSALGTGHTGVRKKVLKACKVAAETIRSKMAGKMKINRLTIDAYGFSRGAAAARNFVYELSKKKGEIDISPSSRTSVKRKADGGELGDLLFKSFIEVNVIHIRFLGLYDTVASLGVMHSNDVKQLDLDKIRKAKYVAQLKAYDEHRKRFALTDISVSRGGKYEFTLPGVHSDIGGGYLDNMTEEVELASATYYNKPLGAEAKLEEERKRFIKEGWYQEGQIFIKETISPNNISYTVNEKLIGKREGLSNKYAIIPLQVMCKLSKIQEVPFDEPGLKAKHPVIADLTQVKERIFEYVFNDIKKKIEFTPITELNGSDSDEQKIADNEMLKYLRNNYLHMSAQDTFVNTPNIKNGNREREIYPG